MRRAKRKRRARQRRLERRARNAKHIAGVLEELGEPDPFATWLTHRLLAHSAAKHAAKANSG